MSLKAADQVVERITAAVESRPTPVRFSAGSEDSPASSPRSYGDPLLSPPAATASAPRCCSAPPPGRLRGLGVDLVAMSANDVITSGARPAFFLDVITCGRIDPDRVAELVEGVAEGCLAAGCALLGGETAEHPDMMEPDEFDMAGFCVGICERRELVGGRPHRGRRRDDRACLKRPALERLLADPPACSSGPERAGRDAGRAWRAQRRRRAARADRDLRQARAAADARPSTSAAMAHITGGGIPGNLARPLPGRPGSRDRPLERGSDRRCSAGWPRSGSRRTRCGASSTSASGTPPWLQRESGRRGALATLERAGKTAWLAGQGGRGRRGDAALRVGVLISGRAPTSRR